MGACTVIYLYCSISLLSKSKLVMDVTIVIFFIFLCNESTFISQKGTVQIFTVE